MMFVTVVVLMCHSIGLPSPVCEEVIATDSNLTIGLTFMGCLSGAQAPLAEWKNGHPIYRSDSWIIDRYKCVAGHYELRGRA